MSGVEDLRTDDLHDRVKWLTREVLELRAQLNGRAGGTVYPNGEPAIVQGPFSDGTHGQRFYDTDGNLLVAVGQLPDTTFGLEVFDIDGVVRARIGQLGGSRYGTQLLDSSDNPILSVDDTGFLYPAIPLQPRDSSLSVIGNGAAFNVTSWWAGVPRIYSDALTVSVGWATGAATTGELRVIAKASPTTGGAVVAATNAVTLGANTNGTQVFNWKHGLTLNTGPWYFGVQTRRTAGATDVVSYGPDYMALVGSSVVSATVTGL